jgi:hypothetical protein
MKINLSGINAVSIILVLFLTAMTTDVFAQNNKTKLPSASAHSHSKLTYKIIDAGNSTYGYDIYSNNSLLIHQNSIPGVAGNQGFDTKAKAGKVAKLVISKINAGQMPPTVTIEDLQKLKTI